jgi:hypothetical protein
MTPSDAAIDLDIGAVSVMLPAISVWARTKLPNLVEYLRLERFGVMAVTLRALGGRKLVI